MRAGELLAVGERCGPYVVVRDLGRGGFGMVYLATGARGEPVALKVMHFDARQPEALIARFQREIHLIAAITHANLVRFYDAGTHAGAHGSMLWMAIEYLEGRTLRDIISAQGGVPLEDALSYCIQVADGLGALHKLGIVHRDVKPENAMLVGGGIVKVFDLGIAKVSGDTTTTGNIRLGTAPYMSPEQFESSDKAKIGPWTDVYALGLMIHELITGQHPLCPADEGLSMAEILGRVMLHMPPPLEQLRPGIPSELSQAAQKAIAKKASERYRTMSDLRDALDVALIRLRLAKHAGSLAAVGGEWSAASLSPTPTGVTAVPISDEPVTTQPRPYVQHAATPPLPQATAQPTESAAFRVVAPAHDLLAHGTAVSSGSGVAVPAAGPKRPGGLTYMGASLAGMMLGVSIAGAVVGGLSVMRARARSVGVATAGPSAIPGTNEVRGEKSDVGPKPTATEESGSQHPEGASSAVPSATLSTSSEPAPVRPTATTGAQPVPANRAPMPKSTRLPTDPMVID